MNDYETLGLRPGGEPAYAEAVITYQQLLAERPGDATLHQEYGYLQECHGRNLIRTAVARPLAATGGDAAVRCVGDGNVREGLSRGL
jgi:hypothetical protein